MDGATGEALGEVLEVITRCHTHKDVEASSCKSGHFYAESYFQLTWALIPPQLWPSMIFPFLHNQFRLFGSRYMRWSVVTTYGR